MGFCTTAGRPSLDPESADAAARPQEPSQDSRGERERADVALLATLDAAPPDGLSADELAARRTLASVGVLPAGSALRVRPGGEAAPWALGQRRDRHAGRVGAGVMQQGTCTRPVPHQSWTVDVQRIERARIVKGWTRAQLGEVAHVARKTLNDMRNARRRPQLGTVQAICRALGLTLSDVIIFACDEPRP